MTTTPTGDFPSDVARMDHPGLQSDPFETSERRALAELAVKFTRTEIAPNMPEWESAGRIPRELHRKAADLGLLGLGVAEEFGGSGGDLVDVTILTESLLAGGGSGGIVAGLMTHGIALPHVLDAAARHAEAGRATTAARLQSELIAPVLAGQSICALGVTEPDGGSDVGALRTRAEPTESGWRINGTKTYITSGARADFVVVAAAVSEYAASGAAGVSLFVVPTDSPGFTVVREFEKMGWHCSDTAELALVNVEIPDDYALTSGPGGGFTSLAKHFAVERLSLATTAYATAARALDLTLDWVRQRETFGRPLVARQVVRHTLVEMHRQVEVAKAYTRGIATRAATGGYEGLPLDAVLAKDTAVQTCEFVVDQAVQLHGGYGFMRDSEVERHYRDARVLGIGGGATEVMTDLAARLMGL